MSRRTEIAYRAQSPGKLATHNEAQGSGDRVNAEVVVLTGYGPLVFGNRPVRTRMPGGVGAVGWGETLLGYPIMPKAKG
jgi:hypothetical protein